MLPWRIAYLRDDVGQTRRALGRQAPRHTVVSPGYVAEFPLFEGTGTRVRPTRMSAHVTEMTLASFKSERCHVRREALSFPATHGAPPCAQVLQRDGSQAGVLSQTKVLS